MKSKILLLLAISFFTVIKSNAQIDKGRYLLGGSGYYYSRTNPKNQAFYSNIQFGKVIKNNSVFGIVATYSSNDYTYSLVTPYKTRTYNTGVFYRKYMTLGNNFYFFGELDASYSYSKNIQDNYNGNMSLNSKSSGASLYFIPGISYTVWKRMQVELSMPNIAFLNYSHITTVDKSLPPGTPPQKANSFNANVALNSQLLSNFGIGFKFLLGK